MSAGDNWQTQMKRPAVLVFAALSFALIVMLVVWWPFFSNQFVMWDDDFNIYENRFILEGNLARFWTEPYMGFFIPVTYTVWFVLARLFTVENPLPFQITNLVFHFLNSVLLFFWLRTLVTMFVPKQIVPGESDEQKDLRRDFFLWLVSLIYLLHPMQVGAVAWHSGLRDLISTTGTLAALICLFRGRTWKSWITAVGLFVLALLSKPASVYLPGLVLMLGLAMPASQRKRLISWSLANLALAGLFVLVTRRIQSQFMIGQEGAPIGDRPFLIMDSYGFYIRQFFFGGPLSADYGRTPARVMEWGLWPETQPWLWVFLLVTLAVFWRFRRAGWAFLMLWLIPLSPTSGLVHFNYQRISTVADHYIQPALPAFCFLLWMIAIEANAWFEQQGREGSGSTSGKKVSRASSWSWGAVVAVFVAILALSGVRTHERIADWRESEVLFHSMLRVTPFSHSANNYLGYFSYRRKDWPAAEKFFRDALASQPNSGIASGNLAYSLIKQGRYAEAHMVLKDFLKNPEFFKENEVHRHVIAMNFLANGLALANLGNYREALASICRVPEFHPERKDLEDATDTLKKLKQQLNPKDPESVQCPQP